MRKWKVRTRRGPPRWGSTCPWRGCVPKSPLHRLGPGSCRCGSCWDSTAYHHGADASTRTDSVSAPDTAWTPFERASLCHRPECADPSEKGCWFVEYPGPSCPPGLPESNVWVCEWDKKLREIPVVMTRSKCLGKHLMTKRGCTTWILLHISEAKIIR